MCGILGICSSAAPVSRDALLAGMRALRHRGPDGSGDWMSPDGRLGLAHTRLSVIDAESGGQPITNEDGRIRVIVNGELYDFEATRRNLERRGHRFRTRSDAEIVVHLYEEYGTACLDHLRGEFAFVLWDSARDMLFAARDRFGIKPLFYATPGPNLYLSSEVKALFAAGVPAAWNREAVFRALFACVSADETLFDGVRQIPPGHFLAVTGNGILMRRYWDAEYPVVADPRGAAPHPAEFIPRVRLLLEEAVRLRMRADVPVGCLLSGGLDSSTVLGLATRYAAYSMAAFTISFDDAAYDEREHAREAAAFSGAEFTVVSASRKRLADHFEESVYQGEILQYNAHGTARFLLSKAVSGSGYKSVLAGEGADELFAGYGFCRPAVLGEHESGSVRGRARSLWRLVRPASPVQQAIAETSPWLAGITRVMSLPDAVLTALAQRTRMMRSLLTADFAAQQRGHDPYRALFEALDAGAKLRKREPARQLIYLWLKTLFPGYVLAADRADMAHGVEVRLPFLDHVLFEYLRTVPVRTLAYGGEIKHLLREVAAPFIAPATRHRLKKPLMAPPFGHNASDPLLVVIQDLLRSSHAKDQPFLDCGALLRALDELRRPRQPGQASLDPLLIMAATLCVLSERYRVRAA